MPIGREIPLADLLPMVGFRLVDPALAPLRQHIPVSTSTHPIQVLALPGSLVASAVLQVFNLGGQVLGPFPGFGLEMRVPDEVGARVGVLLAGGVAGVVVDLEGVGLVGGEVLGGFGEGLLGRHGWGGKLVMNVGFRSVFFFLMMLGFEKEKNEKEEGSFICLLGVCGLPGRYQPA